NKKTQLLLGSWTIWMTLDFRLVRPAGFEPTTTAFGGRYSIQLSYRRIVWPRAVGPMAGTAGSGSIAEFAAAGRLARLRWRRGISCKPGRRNAFLRVAPGEHWPLAFPNRDSLWSPSSPRRGEGANAKSALFHWRGFSSVARVSGRLVSRTRCGYFRPPW